MFSSIGCLYFELITKTSFSDRCMKNLTEALATV